MTTTTDNIVDFPEGRTNEWLIHGVMLIILAFFFAVAVHGVILLFIIPGIIIPFAKAGVDINKSEKKIRRYKQLLGFRMGAWESIADLEKMEIQLLSLKSTHYFQAYYKNSLYTAFELVFHIRNKEAFVFNDFLNYSTICQIADVLAEIQPNAEIQNHIEENIKNSHRRR